MTLCGFYTLAATACAGGWLWTASSVISGEQGMWKGCLLKMLLHVPCPSCGATRSVVAVFRGDVTGAFCSNPLGLLLAVGLVTLPVWLLTDLAFRRATLYRLFLHADALLRRRRIFAVFACAILANWVWMLVRQL